ncbi:MAG: hypothetical protein F7C35_02370 [Desulfurococcales archaeon]|nr:hypothetical protein [Desulfurococcales archaeon]
MPGEARSRDLISEQPAEENLSEKIMENLSVVYEDNDIVVYTAPTEEELKKILLDLLLKHQRMTIRELHRYLSGLASEDKIRYALGKLMKEDQVVVDRDGYYYPKSVYEALMASEEEEPLPEAFAAIDEEIEY